MKLVSCRVQNFRSIEDTGEFDLGQVSCLVGKNEAGKTAILTAISGFNPHPASPISYDVERDYPRRHLNDYGTRHSDEEAPVTSLTWELEPDEIAEVEKYFGAGALRSTQVVGTRHYKSIQPSWAVDLDYKKIVGALLTSAGLAAPERSQVAGATTSDELRIKLAGLPEPTEKQKALLTRISAFPGQDARGMVQKIVADHCPRFMYFSHYDRMVGEIRLDTFPARLAGSQNPSVEPGEQVFVDFLHFAGTSLEEINAAQTYESLNARCESASIKITDQLLEYWRQNPNLSIDVRVTKGEPNDPAPFNAGIVARARVRNDLYRMSVPFSERSAGFIWFFSFLVKFAQVKRDGGAVILVLDEPGLTLHGTAQGDLLRYFDERLAPHHQVVFSTHSPFMVPVNRIGDVKVVEDHLFQSRPGKWDSKGTKVREDALSVDRDTLFPLQGALGYELTQTLFVGKDTLLVEGPSDILYLRTFSEALRKAGRSHLDPRWTICPAGGLDKIQSFVSLFAGNHLNVAALTDYGPGDKRKLDALRSSGIIDQSRVLTFAALLGLAEGDVEDILAPGLYAKILNGCYSLSGENELSAAKLIAAEPATTRLVKKAEAAMRVMPPTVAEFDHFAPADWLLRNAKHLDGKSNDVKETLDRAEQVVEAVNALLT